MTKPDDDEWFSGMLRLLIRECNSRMGSRGAMLSYLLEMALMEAQDMAKEATRNEWRTLTSLAVKARWVRGR